MSEHKKKNYKEKHTVNPEIDPIIKAEIIKREKNNSLPCAVAFDIATKLNRSPAEIGLATDMLNLKLIKCQLGLFGYTPNKKIVTPQQSAKQVLIDAVNTAQVDGRVSCESVWAVAAQYEERKMTISGICEAKKIKIKPCQLGAF